MIKVGNKILVRKSSWKGNGHGEILETQEFLLREAFGMGLLPKNSVVLSIIFEFLGLIGSIGLRVLNIRRCFTRDNIRSGS